MGRRLRALAAAMVVVSTSIGSVVVTGTSASGQEEEEPFRPPGLDPDWPECFRFGGFGEPSLGCAAEDVPGGQANASDYVFLHGRAFRSTGETIENLNGLSPFGQGESIGLVSIGDHTGIEVGTMANGIDGWWGVWVPIERFGEPTPPVAAWIAPLRSYPSLYNWITNIPPNPPPFGAESDPIALGSGGRAVRVDDLVMPGPAVVGAGCVQESYTSEGATVRCTATARHPEHGSAQEYTWTWWHDGQQQPGSPIERVLTADGQYTVELDAVAPDGWQVETQAVVTISECGVNPCMRLAYLPDDFADYGPGDEIPLSVDVTNVGTVDITDVAVSLFEMDPEITVTTPPATIPLLGVGETANVTMTITASEGGSYQFGILADGSLPSGKDTSGNTDGYVDVGGGDLQVRYEGPNRLAVGVPTEVELVVRNDGDEPFTDAFIWAGVESSIVLDVTVPDQSSDLEPGQEVTFPATLLGQSLGRTRVTFEATGSRDDTYSTDRETVDITVGESTGLIVNHPGDDADPDLGDDRCDVDGSEDGDQCTLRAAIEEANTRPGDDTITFELGGSDVSVHAALPVVTDGVVLDGGGGVTVVGEETIDGLTLGGSPSTVSGMTMIGFDRAIVLNSNGHTLEGNRLEANNVGIDVHATASIGHNDIMGTGDGAPGVTNPETLMSASGVGIRITESAGTLTMAGNTFSQLVVGVGAVPDADMGAVVVAGGSFSQVHLGVLAVATAGRSIASVEVSGVQSFSSNVIPVALAGFVGPATVQGNTISGSVFGGVLAVETFEGLTIAGNQMSPCGIVCVLSIANDHFAISGNTLDSGGAGVVAVDDAPTSGDIADNRITGPLGIVAAGQDHVDITGNNVSGSATQVGMIVGAARDLTLSGNTVSAAGAIGVVLGNVTQSAVTGNVVTGSLIGMFGFGREPTPQEQAAFNASGATADEVWATLDHGIGMTYANALASGSDIGPGSFYRAANLFERVNLTGNRLEGNKLGLLLGGGPRGVLVSENEIRGNEYGGIILGAAPGENGPQSVEIRRNTMSGNGTKTPDGLFANIPGILLFQNSGLAYDYSGAKPHPNDPLDADSGPNGMQNFPVLGPVTSSGDKTVVSGVLDSAPGTTYVVDLYGNSACHASNHGEGEVWLAAVDVTTDGSGHGSFSVEVPRQALNHPVTATASAPTPVRLATSEFSPCAFPGVAVGTSAAAPAGSDRLPVATNDGFSIGDAIGIGLGTPTEETARITGFGSLILDRPLRFDHPAGTTITVLPPDSDLAPVCPSATFTTDAGQAVDGTLTCTDEGAIAYGAVGALPAGLTVRPTGALTYQPPAGFAGDVTFQYAATDAAGQTSVPANVTITVRPVATPQMTLTVSNAQFVTRPRVPTAFALTGSFTLPAGAAVSCGDDVTLALDDGLWSQTIPGSQFVRILGICTYIRIRQGGLVSSVVFDPRRGTWLATGLGATGSLKGLTNPVAVSLAIGDDRGATSVTATIR